MWQRKIYINCMINELTKSSRRVINLKYTEVLLILSAIDSGDVVCQKDYQSIYTLYFIRST